MTNFKKNALVCGANQGIGLAITEQLLNHQEFDLIFASHRPQGDIKSLSGLQKKYPNKLVLVEIDADDEESFKRSKESVKRVTPSLDLIINCIGLLSDGKTEPEKSIAEVSSRWLTESFQVNAVASLLIGKYFKSFFKPKRDNAMICLSAKVGSIEDNKSGGWYAYRVSKAALNMAVKNMAIEFNRIGKSCSVFAIHPGTTETNLSLKFLENARKKYKVHSSSETAVNILNLALREDPFVFNGKFISWDGSELPW